MAKIIVFGWSVLVVMFFHIIQQKISLRAYEELKPRRQEMRPLGIEWNSLRAQVDSIVERTRSFRDLSVKKAEL